MYRKPFTVLRQVYIPIYLYALLYLYMYVRACVPATQTATAHVHIQPSCTWQPNEWPSPSLPHKGPAAGVELRQPQVTNWWRLLLKAAGPACSTHSQCCQVLVHVQQWGGGARRNAA